MTHYLRFASGQGEAADVLVEVDAAEDLPVAGEQNAGLRQWARNQAGEAVAVAQSGFEQAVRRAVSLNVGAFLAAADALERAARRNRDHVWPKGHRRGGQPGGRKGRRRVQLPGKDGLETPGRRIAGAGGTI